MNHPVDDKFESTAYLVEANTFETLSLWEKYCNTSGYSNTLYETPMVIWRQLNPGLFLTIGYLDPIEKTKPICVSFSWSRLNGKLIGFWEATSQVVDYNMIEKWMDDNLSGIPRTNAMNFNHVFQVIM